MPILRKQDLTKFVKSLFAYEPLRGLQSATSKSFAISRGVAQRDGIGARIEADFVSARMRSGTVRADVDGASISRALHLLDNLKQSAGRRVFLGRMMDLPSPGAIFRLIRDQARGFGGQPQKHVDADGIIGAPDQPDAFLLDRVFHALQMLEPACGPDDYIYAQGGNALDVLDH